MVTIVWNLTDFLRIAALRKGEKFNVNYYISEILVPLPEWRAGQVGATDRNLIVPSDNVRSHTAKRVNQFLINNGMMKALHLLYSPDFAPYDFFLFSHIKSQLMGRSFDDGDQLLMAIKEICKFIERVVLEKVFHEWRDRLAKCLVGRSGLVENTSKFSE
jgi:hypothetical protein